MDKRLLERLTPRVRLICDCLEETIFAEASPIVFGIACHQIGGPQIVEDASQTAVRRREITRECPSWRYRPTPVWRMQRWYVVSFAPISAASSGWANMYVVPRLSARMKPTRIARFACAQPSSTMIAVNW
jgi:hypothetical protein